MNPGMFEDVIIENLLAIVAAYRKATGKSLTSVSKDFYGRGDFFAKLRKGDHTIGIGRLSRMIDAFRDRWPDETPWPMTRPVFMTKAPPRK
jgi:hypothetical protein